MENDMTAVARAKEPEEKKESLPALGRYQTIVKLGSGGMADVYLAASRGPSGFRKLLVLKMLHKHLAQDREFVDMFMHEARLAARLNHPNVVQTYDVSQENDRFVLSMEFLEGTSLGGLRVRAAKAREPLSMDLQVRVMLDALMGLHYAHELCDFDGSLLNLVHRDVSPNNIYVTYAGQVKVLDFGIAKSGYTTSTTQTGVLKGTLRYLSPEAVLGNPLDRRSDIFSAGVILWEAISGVRMWKGLSDVTILQKIAAGEIPPVQIDETQMSPSAELVRICTKALMGDREERYATALEFHDELDNYLAERSRVGNRQLADLVTTLFQEERRQLQVLVDTQLAHLDALAADPNAKVDSLAVVAFEGFRREDERASATHSAVNSRRRVASRLWLVLSLGAVLVATLGVAASRFGAQRKAEPPRKEGTEAMDRATAELRQAAVQAVQAEASQRSAAVTDFVTVRVKASPAQAEVFFEGEKLEGNPATAQRPRSHVTGTVRVTAEGYLPKTEDVWLDQDHSIVVSLDRKPEEFRGRNRRGAEPSRRGNEATGSLPPPASAPARASDDQPANSKQIDKANPWAN